MLVYRHKKRLEAEANEQKRQSQAGREERHALEAEQEAQRGEETETLTDKKVPELKNIAKEHGIEGFSNMKKDKLIQAIEGD